MGAEPVSEGAPGSQVPDVVAASPRLVLAHDKAGWLALFADGAVVEDPVGTPAQRKVGTESDGGALGRFYETFIAPNKVVFDVSTDVVAGNETVREVRIDTTLGTGFEASVPAYIYYEVVDQAGETKIQRLRAIWELRRVSLGSLKSPRGWWTLLKQTWRMLRVQGLSGTMSYSGGMFRGIFGRGHQALQAFQAAVERQDPEAFTGLFHDDASVVEFPIGRMLSPVAFLGEAKSVVLRAPKSAGWLTACGFAVKDGPTGLAIFEFDPGSKRILKARLFGDGAAAP